MQTNKHHETINHCKERKPRPMWHDYLLIAIALIIIIMQAIIICIKPITPPPNVEAQPATIDTVETYDEYFGTIKAHLECAGNFRRKRPDPKLGGRQSGCGFSFLPGSHPAKNQCPGYFRQ